MKMMNMDPAENVYEYLMVRDLIPRGYAGKLSRVAFRMSSAVRSGMLRNGLWLNATSSTVI